MRVVVDTAVWSLMLRRRRGAPSAEVRELEELIREGHAAIIGPIRQELLSGVKNTAQFENLRLHLRGFPDIGLEIADYELAAEFSNRCKSRGVQGSGIDFLICAVAHRRKQSVFTTDGDFASFARFIPLQLHAPRA